MKYLLTTLASAAFFVALGAMLLLTAPRLIEIARNGGLAAALPLVETQNTQLSAVTPPAQPAPLALYGDHRFRFEQAERRWLGRGPQKGQPLRPALILLDASGRDGLALLASWEALAMAQDLVLVAPYAATPIGWSAQADGAAFLTAVLQQASSLYAIDPAQVYVFAQAKGADLALSLAAEPPGDAKAMALIAATKLPPDHGTARPAIRFYRGHQGPLPLPDDLRRIAKEYAQAGYPTELVAVSSAASERLTASPDLAADAWDFLRQN